MIEDKEFEIREGSEAMMFNFLTPYIEEAGYTWEIKRDISRLAVFVVTIKKASNE